MLSYRRLPVFVIGLTLLASPLQAEPFKIGSFQLVLDVHVQLPIDVVSFSVSYPPDRSQGCDPCLSGPRVLEAEFRPADVGASVTADKGSDPEFSAFTALLGNARADNMEFWFEVPPGRPDLSGFGREAFDKVLFPDDWTAYDIRAVSFLLTRFEFDDTNPIIIEGLPYYRNRFAGELNVFAEAAAPVPEPATLTLLGIGLAALGLRERRRRASSTMPDVR